MKMVYGKLPREENCLPVRVRVLVKVRVSFRVRGGGATRQLPRRQIDPWLGLGFELGLVLGFGGNFPRGNCPRNY